MVETVKCLRAESDIDSDSEGSDRPVAKSSSSRLPTRTRSSLVPDATKSSAV